MSKQNFTYTGAVASRDNAATIGPKLQALSDRLYDFEIYPEDKDAVGDGSTNDTTALSSYVTQLNSGSNKAKGVSRVTTYLMDTALVFTRNVMLDFVGVLKRTSSAAAMTMVDFQLGTAGFTKTSINVDGNLSNNSNAVTGIKVSAGSNNTLSEHKLAAQDCTIGVVIEGNTEKLRVDAYVRSCGIGVNIHNDGTSNTVDELALKITGAGFTTNALLVDGSEKVSAVVDFAVEQIDTAGAYAVDQQTGWLTSSGEIRSVEGGFTITSAALLSNFNNLLLVGKASNASDSPALMCDTATCRLQGSIILNGWKDGLWIKRCSGGSYLHISRVDTGSTGTGLRIGDFANSKQAVFNFKGTLFGATSLNLDYATQSVIDIDQILDTPAIVISANSSRNKILIPFSFRAAAITNSRTELDNIIIYKNSYTGPEMEEINAGTWFKGMIVEHSVGSNVYGPSAYSGTAWVNLATGLTYNTSTNAWA